MERIEIALTGSTRHENKVTAETNQVGEGQDSMMVGDLSADEKRTDNKRIIGMKACFHALMKISGLSYSKKYNVTELNI